MTAAQRAADERTAQGLPPTITDPTVLAAIAAVFTGRETCPSPSPDRTTDKDRSAAA